MKLNQKQQLLLKEVIVSQKPERSELIIKTLNNKLSPEERREVCLIINDHFIEHGLGPVDEPNNFGLELENLLDVVNDIKNR